MPGVGHVNNGITAGFNPVARQSLHNLLNIQALTEWSLFDQGNGFAQIEALSSSRRANTHRVIHKFCG
jgi:hypothetical protein